MGRPVVESSEPEDGWREGRSLSMVKKGLRLVETKAFLF
jgi:hypothetical protein